MRILRKLLSILLLLGFGLPFASGLVASGVVPGSGLPMCCRKSGKHHCGMSMAAMTAMASASAAPQVGAPAERCPWRPLLGTAPHIDVFSVAWVRFDAVARLTRVPLPAARMGRYRSSTSSRTTRGPPSLESL